MKKFDTVLLILLPIGELFCGIILIIFTILKYDAAWQMILYAIYFRAQRFHIEWQIKNTTYP